MSDDLKGYIESQEEEDAEKDSGMENELKQYEKDMKQYDKVQKQYEKDMKQYHKQVDNYKDTINNYDSKIADHNNKINQYKEKINEHNVDLENKQAEYLKLIKDFKQAMGTYLQKTTELKTNMDSLMSQDIQMITSQNRKEYKKQLEDEGKTEQEIEESLKTYDHNTSAMNNAKKDFEGVFNELEDIFNNVLEKIWISSRTN